MTEFEVNDEYIKRYKVQCVGDNCHQELWIPAEELKNFNDNIIGVIQIKEAFYGDKYMGINPDQVAGFKEKDLKKQIDIFRNILEYNAMDFSGTVFVEWKLINLNYLFWLTHNKNDTKTLVAIYECLLKNKKFYVNLDFKIE